MLRVYDAVRRSGKKKAILGVAGAVVVMLAMFGLMSSHYAEGTVDPMVGVQHWGSGVSRRTGLGVYRVWESADFKGGDLMFKETKGIDECLYACDEHRECVYVSYHKGLCYLKDNPTAFESFKHRASLFAAKRVQVRPVAGDDWHDANVIETAKSHYKLFHNHVFDGNVHRELSQPDQDSCLRACDDDDDCEHVDFDGRRCRLMKDDRHVNRVKQPGSTAALKTRLKHAPDPLVKQHWAKGGRHETNEAVYQTWAGCQFHGDSIGTVKAMSIERCLEECDQEIFCKHVTLIGKECMLQGWAPEYFEIVPGRSDLWAAKKVESKNSAPKHRVVNNGLPPSEDDVKDLREDFLVGEYYDESEEHTTRFNRYRVWEGFDFVGGDLHTNSLNLDSYTLESCLEACDHKPECAHVVAINGKECWLKSHPYQLTRIVDERTDVHAAMKLGRVGKTGLDAKTRAKNTNRPSRRLGRPSLSFTTGDDAFALPWHPHHRHHKAAKMVGMVLGGGALGVAVVGAVLFYWQKLQGSYYVNELS